MSSYSLHRTEVFKQTEKSEKPAILVCLQNPTDRRLIKQFLSDRYEVLVSDGDLFNHDFDLCIIDRPTFKQYQEQIVTYKEDQAPLIIPFLLFVKGEHWSKTIDPVWDIVDDVVPIPTPTPILISRIDRMLQTRKHSLELKDKNERLSMFEQAINATNAGVLITDVTKEDNPIIFANEGFEKLTDYSREEIQGRNCRFLQEDDQEQVALDDLRSLIDSGKEGHALLRNYRKDGTLFWNELRIAPITNQQGNTTHFVGIQNDVTELVETQEKLKKEKDRYQLIAENATDMIARHVPDGTYLYVSPSSEQLLGYTPQELIGENPYETIHPDDRKGVREKYEKLLVGREMVKYTYRKKTKDGSYKWVESLSKTVSDPDTDEVVEIQSSTRDISERKEYEEELQSEKDFINAAVDNMPGIFFMLDEDLNFIYWNRNLEEELGYTHGEVKEMHPLEFFAEKDQKTVRQKIGEILQTGKSEVEIDVTSKSGEVFRYYLIGSRLKRHGRQYIVGSGVNTTERVEAEFKSEQQQKLLSAVINQTESVIYVKDQEGRYRLVNNTLLDHVGMERAEVIGKTDIELFDNEFAKEVRANDVKVIETGKTLEFEEELKVGDKPLKFLSIKNTLKGIPGFEDCVCGVSTDITEREEAYHKLRERNKEKSCLYSISNLNEVYSSVDKILEEAVKIIPSGFQYPEIAEAAIEFDGKIYTTPGFSHTRWGLIAESHNYKSKSVAVKVVYLEEKSSFAEKPFLQEEQELMNAIADALASEIERIISRENLIESEKRWEQLVQKNPGLVQIIDNDKILFINPAGARIYGVESTDELIGKSWSEFIHVKEDDQETETLKKRIGRAMDGDLAPPKVYRAWTADGTIRFVELQSVPIQYRGRKALMTVGQEVTERIQYEDELKKTNEQLEQAQKIAEIGYWTHQIAENRSDWSEQMYKIWERSRETYTPNFENFLETIHPEDKELFESSPKEAFPDRDYYDHEHRIITPEGKVKWILERITLHRDEKGQPKMMEGIAQNITEQKTKEKVIREALKEKEILLQEIHHRVKNNLAVISGLLQIQRFSSENEEVNKILSDSEMRIKSMALIHEKLYQAESLSEIDFKYYIEDLLGVIEQTIRGEEKFSTQLKCDSVTLNVNQAVPCALILNELISNSVEHAFENRKDGKVTIEMMERDNTVFVKVLDNGKGLPADFSLDDHLSMGFTIIKTLINQLNANFEVANENGASFSFSFEKRAIKGSSSNLM